MLKYFSLAVFGPREFCWDPNLRVHESVLTWEQISLDLSAKLNNRMLTL